MATGNVRALTTAEWAAGFDEDMLEALRIAEEVPAFAEEILDQLADDWCRSQHSVSELYDRQALAGTVIAPVAQLPIPATRFRHSGLVRAVA